MSVLTLGVEEEFLLLGAEGAVMPVAPDVLGSTSDDPRIQRELMTFQVETASGVCTRLDDLGRQLAELRLRVAEVAGRHGARLVAAGAPPFGDGGLALLSDVARYRQLASRFPSATAVSGTCACQVHVGVADRDLAAQVLGRLRPWLPVLLGLTANSPVSAGLDNGWLSNRYRRQLQWPTFRPPQPWHSAAGYDRVATSLIRGGAALDPGSVYFLARLSPRYPTIEVRIADTCLDVRDAVLLAALVRGLVGALATDVRLGRPTAAISGPALRARLLGVARHGLPAGTIRPRTNAVDDVLGPGVTALTEKIRPELERAGDADIVVAGMQRLLAAGTGAQRQRTLHVGRSPAAFVAALAESSLPARTPQ